MSPNRLIGSLYEAYTIKNSPLVFSFTYVKGYYSRKIVRWARMIVGANWRECSSAQQPTATAILHHFVTFFATLSKSVEIFRNPLERNQKK